MGISVRMDLFSLIQLARAGCGSLWGREAQTALELLCSCSVLPGPILPVFHHLLRWRLVVTMEEQHQEELTSAGKNFHRSYEKTLSEVNA